jgi:CRISPR-associated protein Cas2
MRDLYLVSYDISDPNRLRRTYRCMRGYGDPLQLSVFRCELNLRERQRLEAALHAIIDPAADQVLFCRIGPAHAATHDRLETLGRPLLHPERHAVVI